MDKDEKETRWDPGGDFGGQENWLTFWNKLAQMAFLMRKVVRILKCFLFRIVIQINHEAEEIKHLMLANY